MTQGNYVNIGQNVQCSNLLVGNIEGNPTITAATGNFTSVVTSQLAVNGPASASTLTLSGLPHVNTLTANFASTGETTNTIAAAQFNNTGTFDCTAIGLVTYGVFANVSASRSAGANPLASIGLYANVTGAQINRALQTDAGDVLLNSVSGNCSANGPLIANSSFTANGIVSIGPFGRVNGANFTTSSASLVNVTGMSLALSANAIYLFTAIISCASSDVNGLKFGVQYSAAGATVEAQVMGTLAAGSAQGVRVNTFNTATATFVTVAADGVVEINGLVGIGANAGNLTIQVLKVTAGTATVYQQSYMTATRIG